jgi:DNA sulfur modification protein DndE
LRDRAILAPENYPEDGIELNRYTLTGEYDAAFIALLIFWLYKNSIPINDKTSTIYFRAHLNRGALLLSNKIKSITDLALLE